MEILEQNAAYVVCIKPAGIPAQGEEANAMPALLAAEISGEIYPCLLYTSPSPRDS